ncbi:hypothetical protein ACFL26_00815 [Patescibacteria group bacterium]
MFTLFMYGLPLVLVVPAAYLILRDLRQSGVPGLLMLATLLILLAVWTLLGVQALR